VVGPKKPCGFSLNLSHKKITYKMPLFLFLILIALHRMAFALGFISNYCRKVFYSSFKQSTNEDKKASEDINNKIEEPIILFSIVT
jgi:hypothetical protein